MTGTAHDYVRVTFESLNDFFRLQVPQVNTVVFRSAHDPFRARDGEVSEQAVLLILVSSVQFQRFALGIIPQFQCVVQRRGQDILSVGREFDKTNGWIVIIDQCLQTHARRGIPDATETIVGRRDNHRTVATIA